jgi:hypothetical protein
MAKWLIPDQMSRGDLVRLKNAIDDLVKFADKMALSDVMTIGQLKGARQAIEDHLKTPSAKGLATRLAEQTDSTSKAMEILALNQEQMIRLLERIEDRVPAKGPRQKRRKAAKKK